MLDQISEYFNFFTQSYQESLNYLPQGIGEAFIVLVFAFFITVTALFVWKFYKTLSQKDFINLNLKQYNRFSHPSRRKFFAVILYLLENIIIMPFFIMIWFSALSVILLMISDQSSVSYLLLLTSALVISVRFLSYVNKSISTDLAKLFPFIALSVFLLSPHLVSFDSLGLKIAEISSLLDNILYYLITITVVEAILRIVSTIAYVIKNKDSDDPWSLESYGYAQNIKQKVTAKPEELPDGEDAE